MNALIAMTPVSEYKCHLRQSPNDDHPSPMYDEGWQVTITENEVVTQSERFVVFETEPYKKKCEAKASAEDLCIVAGLRLEKLGFVITLQV